MAITMKKEELVSWLLRIGLASVLFYAAIDSFLNPIAWIGFFPAWMRAVVDGNILLPFFSVYELLLGSWLLWGKKMRYAGLLSVATFVGIILSNLGAFNLVFRDVTMVFSALALAVLHWEG